MSGLGPGDVGSPPVPGGSLKGLWMGWEMGFRVSGAGWRYLRRQRGRRGLSSPGCCPWAPEGQLEDLSLGESFFLASSD